MKRTGFITALGALFIVPSIPIAAPANTLLNPCAEIFYETPPRYWATLRWPNMGAIKNYTMMGSRENVARSIKHKMETETEYQIFIYTQDPRGLTPVERVGAEIGGVCFFLEYGTTVWCQKIEFNAFLDPSREFPSDWQTKSTAVA
ncbi:MAG: hypothetical protein JWL83_59 [Actinomycetia bacterium]|nr:hypothetical protein [Actinomycetes bacterium]